MAAEELSRAHDKPGEGRAVQRNAPLALRGALAVVEPSPTDWDAFVLRHPHGHLLQLSPWGNLKAGFGWTAQRIAVLGVPRAGDDATAVQPQILAGTQVLWRQRYGFSGAYVPRGPLLSGDAAIDDVLMATLAQTARRRRAVFLRCEPNYLADDPQADALHTWLLLKGFQPSDPIQPRSSIHLDLTPPLERIFALFSKGHRADIRRAERQGVNVRAGGAEDIGIFYAIMRATGARAAFGVHAEDYYRSAWQLFQPRSRLLLAEQAGSVVAAHMVFADAQAGLYLYSGATEAGLKTGANHLLAWHAIQWARNEGCTTYDLWGIPDALGRAAATSDEQERALLEEAAQADPLIGVYRFKKGFGGRVLRYLPAYDQIFLPPLYKIWKRRFG